MNGCLILFSLFCFFYQGSAIAGPPPQLTCEDALKGISGEWDEASLNDACAHQGQLSGCQSVAGTPLYHFDWKASKSWTPRILVMGLLHGDEPWSALTLKKWMEKISKDQPLISWRFLPYVNPDGYSQTTRTNKNGVDLNRNFPTRDWNERALSFWKREMKGNPRTFPGKSGGSEPETQCILKQIEKFQPDLVISLHSPYYQMELDGPFRLKTVLRKTYPGLKHGTFPGTLGRYLWDERKIPVLTVELAEFSREQLEKNLSDLIESIKNAKVGIRPRSPKSTQNLIDTRQER